MGSVGGRWISVVLKCRLSWWLRAGAGGDDGVDKRVVDHVIGLVGYVGLVVDWRRGITWSGSGRVRCAVAAVIGGLGIHIVH